MPNAGPRVKAKIELLATLQLHNRRAPTAEKFSRQCKGFHALMLCENRMNRATKIANTLAMNDSNPKNSPGFALGKVIRHEAFDLARLEGVQIKHAIYRQLNRLIIHALIQPRTRRGEN